MVARSSQLHREHPHIESVCSTAYVASPSG